MGKPIKPLWLRDDRKRQSRSKTRAEYEGLDEIEKAEIIEKTTVGEQTRMDVFIRHYLTCFQASRAAVLMGYQPSGARRTGHALYWHPYTQTVLRQKLDELEESAIVSNKQVMTALWDMAQNAGNDSEKIKALCQLAKIKGMEVTKVQTDVVHHGVMEVPVKGGADSWEDRASRMQAELIARADAVATGERN